MIVGAKSRNVVASVGRSTPGGAGLESQALAAVVVGCTTVRNLDAGSGSAAPGEAGVADTVASSTVVVVGTS